MLVAVSGVECVQDLFNPHAPPPHYSFTVTPDSAVVNVGDTAAPFTALLTADGKTVGFRTAVTVVQGQGVVRADSQGRLVVLGRGVATLRLRPLSVALPTDTLAATVKVWAVVPRIGLATGRTEDTLVSLKDTLALQATALTRSGTAIPNAPIVWKQISGAGAVTLLDSVGRVRAEANGVAVFEASVDTAHAQRTVRVQQVARSLVNTLDTVRFSAIGQTRRDSATVRDARAFAVASATAAWQSGNTGVVTQCCHGALTAVGEGTTIVIASYAGTGGTVADTTTVIVRRMRLAALSGGNQTATVGAATAAPLVVQLVDSVGGAVHDSGVAVVFKVTGGGGKFAGQDSVVVATDPQGHALATPVLGTVVGANGFTAYGPGLTGSPVAFAATAGPAAGRTIAADSGVGQSGTVGQALAQTFVVVVRDTFANAVPGVSVTFKVKAGGGKLAGHDSLVTATDGQGRARATLTLGTAAQTDTVEARANVPVGSPALFTAVAGPAAAKTVKFTSPPTSIVAGTSFSPALQVTVRDTFGNLVTDLFRQVTLGLVPGTGTSGAHLSGTASVGTAAGIAAFGSDLTLGLVGTGYKLVATAPGLAADTSAAFSVTPGAPDHLVFQVPPGVGVAGKALRPALQVAVLDASSNVVTTSTLEIALEIYRIPAGGSASLFGTPTVTAVGGIATFSDVGIALAASGYKLRAKAASGQLTVVSDLFDVRGVPATILKISGDNRNGPAGTLLDSAFVVAVRDASGYNVPGDTVIFKVTAGGGKLGGADSLIAVTDVNGQASARLTLGSGAATNTVTARSASLAGQSVAFTATAISGVLHLAFAVQPGTILVAGTFSPAVTVEVHDASEQVVTSVPVTVTLTLAGGNPSAALTGSVAVPTVNGVATFAGVGVNRSGTGFTLTASAGTLTSATSTTFSVLSVPTSITKTSGDNQNGVVGTVLGASFIVTVLDAASDPVVGDSVVFKVTSGSAAFAGVDSVIVLTDGSGHALSQLTLGATPGAVTVTARSKHLAGQSVTFNASATVSGRQLEFVVQPSYFAAGGTFSQGAPQVRVRDTYGNTDLGATTIITLAITAGTGATGAHLIGTTSVAAVNGVATFPGLTIDLVAQNYTLTASATGLDQATSSVFFVTFGAAKLLRLSSVPTQTVAGAPFTVEVQVLDSLGNLYAFSPGPAVTIAISGGTGTAGAHLRGTLTQNGTGSGSASFAGLSIDSAGTGYTLTVTSPGLSSHTSAVITVAPAPAVRLAFSVQPSAVTAGVAMSPAAVALVQDSLGNTVTSSAAAVTLAFGSSPTGATLSGTTSVAAVNGVATFANLRIVRSWTNYTLVASTPGLTSATSSTFGVLAAPPSKLVFLAQPSNALPGVVIAPAVQVAMQDSVGNLTPGTNAVTLAITSGTGTSGATLAGTTTVNAVNGLASFANLSIAAQGNNYTLTATASGLGSGVSGAFSVLSAGASRLVFTVAPSSATAGAAFGAPVQVAVQDGSGSTVATATNAITLAITSGSGTANAHLRGTVTVGAVSGVATFPGLSIDSAGAGFTLTATSGALANGTSGQFTVLPAPAIKLEWRAQPTSRTAGSPFLPAIQVALRDSLGNLATATATSVTMVITAGTGAAGAVLAGTTPVTSVNGVVTFADLSIAKAGTGYTLTASASGLPAIVSGTFSITNGAVATITVTPAGASLSGVGATTTFAATAKDSLGNLIGGATFTWSSLNPSVATMNASTGGVTAVASGQVTISATVGSVTGYALLTVAVPSAVPVNLWTPLTSGQSQIVFGVWGSSASNIYAVTGNSILHSDGVNWTVSSGTFGGTAVWGASASEIYAVSYIGVARFNGSGWSAMSAPSASLHAVWGSSPSDIFAVGENGTILHYDGASWSTMPSGTSQALHGVWGTSASNVYAVGYGGTILRFDGSSWSAMQSGTTNRLWSVWGTSSSDVYAGEEVGTVRHFDGVNWSDMAPGFVGMFYGLWGASNSDIYVAAATNLLRFNGTAWSQPAMSPDALYGIWGTSSAEVWAVGWYGRVMRGSRGASVVVTPAADTLTAVGATRQLTATAKDAANATITGLTNSSYTWQSDSPGVASVSASGLVTAVANGTATITATAPGGASGTTVVTVIQAPKAVVVYPAGFTLNGVNSGIGMAAQARDSLGSLIPSAIFTWATLNPNVATINASTGVATAVGSGQVTVSATSGGLTAYALLTVATPGLAPVNLWARTLTADTILFAVWGTSASNVYAVGAGGRILHYDGANWTPMASPTTQRLSNVWGSSSSDVYALGDGGLMHFNGSSWSAVGNGPTGGQGLWGSSPSDVWVGQWHYNGATWSSRGGTSPYAIWGSSFNNVYAVGYAGMIVHYDGTSWTPVTSGTTDDFLAIWGISASNVYAAASPNPSSVPSIVLHFDGSSWAPMQDTVRTAIQAFGGASPSDIYAVGGLRGSGQVLAIQHYDGTSWTIQTNPGANLYGIWGAPGGDVFAVGGPIDTPHSVILRGIRGATVAVTPANPTLSAVGATQQLAVTAKDASGNAVAGVTFTWASSDTTKAKVDSTGKVTAVANGTPTITATAAGGASGSTTVTVSQVASRVAVNGGRSFQGIGATENYQTTVYDSRNYIIAGASVTWSSLNPNVATIDATGHLTTAGPGQVTIAATSGAVTGYALLTVAVDGAAPNLFVSAAGVPSQLMTGVWAASPTNAFAVGYGGTILHWNGSSWTSQTSGTGNALTGVWGVSPTDVFAVGMYSALHWNGTTWTAQPGITDQVLLGVWGASPTDVWAVGGVGVIMHWDGSSWTAQPSGTTQALRSVWGTSPTNVYAVGDGGVMLHYDGTSWTAQASPTTGTIYSLWGTTPSSVFAVADNWQRLRWGGSSWAVDVLVPALAGVGGTSPTNVIGVGASGGIVRWNGGAWTTLTSGTTQQLLSVWSTSPTSLLVTGNNGTILHGYAGATVVVTPATPTLTAVGATQQLVATAKDASSNTITGVTGWAWSSATPSVASVDAATGVVTAVAIGTAVITAAAPGGASGSTTVTVTQAPAVVTVVPAGATLIGGNTTVTATAKDANGNTINGATFAWASLNPNVATINPSTGTATAVASGQVTVSATLSGVTGYALLTVAIPGATPVNLWVPDAVGLTANHLTGLWAASASDVFAVGLNGTILRFTGTWSVAPSAAGPLQEVWGLSANDVFAVSDASEAYRFNGSTWSRLVMSHGSQGVWGTGPTNVMAVGTSGAISRFDGASFSPMVSNTASQLNGIWGVDSANAFVVGDAGTILRYNGAAWVPMTSNTSQTLRAVWGAAANNVYAAGADNVMHYDGTAWSAMAGSNGNYRDLWGSSASDLYAVGLGGLIQRYNGSLWSTMTSGTTNDLLAVRGTRDGYVFAVGLSGTILRGVRGATVTVYTEGPSWRLTALGATMQAKAAVRDAGALVSGLTLTWTSNSPGVATVDATGKVTAVANGSAWIIATAPGGAADSATVYVSQEAKVVAVSPAGASVVGAGQIQAFTATARDSLGNAIAGAGVTWASLNPNVATINSSTGVATAVSSGQVTISATADGLTGYALLTVAIPGATAVNLWTPLGTGAAGALNPVWGVADTLLYVGGSYGGGSVAEVIRFNGTVWSKQTLPGSLSGTITALWGSSASDVWAVTGGSQVVRFNGASWVSAGTGQPCVAYGMWGSAPNDIFVVGASGCIAHYNGSGWSQMTSGVSSQITSVFGFAGNDVWAVTYSGQLVHYNGSSWQTSQTVAGAFRDVWGSAPSDVWAVGDAGVIYRYNGSAWQPAAVSPGNFQIDGIWGSSSADVYVGHQGGGVTDLVYRFDGSAWTRYTGLSVDNVARVWGASGGSVWLAGDAARAWRGYRAATVAVTPASPTLTAIGATQQLTATAKDASSNTITGVTGWAWSSATPSVASVDAATGVVTAVANGTAVITAAAPGGASGSTTVTVSQVASRVAVNGGRIFQGIGATENYQTTVYDSRNFIIAGPSVTWSSLNPSVATIDASGHLTTAGPGQVIIAATSGSAIGYALLTVSVPGLAPVNLWARMVSGDTDQLLGVWGTSSTNVFAVGGRFNVHGLILHYDGASWSHMTNSASGQLSTVWGSSGSDVFAAGENGTILHFNGTTWSDMSSGTPYYLHGVWGASPKDVFAAGMEGTVLHYDGASWSQMTSGTPNILGGLWGLSGSEVFGTGCGGTILRYDGASWASMGSGASGCIFGVWGTSATDVFGAVSDPTVGLLHYDGSSWGAVAGSGSMPSFRVSGTAHSDVYAIAQSPYRIVKYDGTSVSTMSGTAQSGQYLGIWASPSGDVFVVGDSGEILRGYRSATVAVTPASPTLTAIGATQQLTATARDAASTVVGGVTFTWTSGTPGVATVDSTGKVTAVANGTAVITATAPGGTSGSTTVTVSQLAASIAVSPTSVTITTIGSSQIFTAVARDANGNPIAGKVLGWGANNLEVATMNNGTATATGSGQTGIFAFADGAMGEALVTVAPAVVTPVNLWKADVSNTTQTLIGVWGSYPTDLYAVGLGGTIQHYDGSTWSGVSSPTTQVLRGVWGATNASVYAVGDAGTLLRYNGYSWAQRTSNTSQVLRRIWGSSTSNIIAVGDNGTIVRLNDYTGGTATTMTSGTVLNLNDVWGDAANDVFAVGVGGTILRYNGSAWTAMTSPTTQNLLGVWGRSASDVYAVGVGGTVVRFNGSTWSQMAPFTGQDFVSVWGSSGSDIYAVSTIGGIFRFDGSSWSLFSSLTTSVLQGAWGTSDANVIIVGNSGTILRGYRAATVAVTPAAPTLTGPGATKQLVATAKDASNNTITGVTGWAWSSATPSVASVDAVTGVVTAVTNGTATITATAPGGASGSTTVTAISFTQVSAGGLHTCGLTSVGSAYCWGSNGEGQLGNGSTIPSGTPVPVSGELTFAAVSSGNEHTCGLTTAGAVYCWGYNSNGQLGNGSTTNSSTPVPVSGGLTFVAISAGHYHTCGVTSTGAAYCWGVNGQRQLGLGAGSVDDKSTPMAVSGGLTFATVSAGLSHTCGLTSTGGAYCWGSNNQGELGDGSTIPSGTPLPVPGGLTFAAVSSGEEHTCGLATAGVLYCWGYNSNGQLGDGSTTKDSTPVMVSGGLTFASVSAGSEHTCGVTTAGVAYCWGANGSGQLGNASTADSSTPVAVSGGLTFVTVTTDTYHTCGVAPTGVAYCWGANGGGELGNPSTTGSLTPVAVTFP